MASRTSSDVDTVTTVPSRTTFHDRSVSLSNFLHNTREGTFFYKTPARWCKLIGFYFIFYSALIFITAGLLAAVYNILDWNYPSMRGPDSIFRGNPGLSFRPNPDYDSTLIRYVKGDGPTTRKYIDHLEAYIRFYENKNQIVSIFNHYISNISISISHRPPLEISKLLLFPQCNLKLFLTCWFWYPFSSYITHETSVTSSPNILLY